IVADVKAQGYCFPCWIWLASWFILALQILIEVNLRQHALPSFYFVGGAGLALRINHKLLHDRSSLRQLHLISTSPAVNPCSKECAIWY
ncbi:hypothetical protein NC652_004338, partial [Populus alba x Populus x berolinensis]